MKKDLGGLIFKIKTEMSFMRCDLYRIFIFNEFKKGIKVFFKV